jgi:hypothetical protein
MKLDWQHALIVVALICGVSTVIVLGHGQTLIQVLAALGGAGTLAALLKSSPLDPKPGTVVVTPPVVEFPPEADTKKEGRSVPPGTP